MTDTDLDEILSYVAQFLPQGVGVNLKAELKQWALRERLDELGKVYKILGDEIEKDERDGLHTETDGFAYVYERITEINKQLGEDND